MTEAVLKLENRMRAHASVCCAGKTDLLGGIFAARASAAAGVSWQKKHHRFLQVARAPLASGRAIVFSSFDARCGARTLRTAEAFLVFSTSVTLRAFAWRLRLSLGIPGAWAGFADFTRTRRRCRCLAKPRRRAAHEQKSVAR